MIKEIFSFDAYEEFIKDVSNNSVFADPHFEFDNSNLYDSLKKIIEKLISLQKEKGSTDCLYG